MAEETGIVERIEQVDIDEQMKSSYIDYAMSVIVSRALPDVRDGLKPVHRRVLYAMHELKNNWNSAYKKSARVVGDVIGKYHPHGDSAVYMTIVRMAQPFSLRYMFVDGQGNFGSVDGDNPAAMRYTEIRMAKIAHEMLADIEEETVNFGDNYDGSEQEPLVLPTRFPALLVNGSEGIAVGVATGGYTSQTLNPQLKDRIMPILANSIVTRPLAPAEIEANGLRTFQIITDTRVLRHYYRVLPDGRLQIGTRSAITGSDATAPRHLDLVRAGLARKFPGLRDVAIDYYWWGWVDVSHDMMPRIAQPDPHSALYYALGYGGNGVSYSAQAGRRLAQHIAGKTADVPKLPIFEGALPYPDFAGLFNARWLAPFRRLGQWGLYHWYHLKDERL